MNIDLNSKYAVTKQHPILKGNVVLLCPNKVTERFRTNVDWKADIYDITSPTMSLWLELNWIIKIN